MTYKRQHHQHVASILTSLDSELLKTNKCYFGGGTAIALLNDEFRESHDIDFLISDKDGYRFLRGLLTGEAGFSILAKQGGIITQIGDVRADQYGIRGKVKINNAIIKMEIVLEGRIELETPGPNDVICGVTSLSDTDLIAEKLLANSDRWNDISIFGRDIIDLSMMSSGKGLIKTAMLKAEDAYGASIKRDLEKAINQMLNKEKWVDRCIDGMSMHLSKAELLQRISTFSHHAGVKSIIRP